MWWCDEASAVVVMAATVGTRWKAEEVIAAFIVNGYSVCSGGSGGNRVGSGCGSRGWSDMIAVVSSKCDGGSGRNGTRPFTFC